MSAIANIPSSPVLLPNGQLSPAWLAFFLALFVRTGGTEGISLADIQKAIALLQAEDATSKAQIAELQTDDMAAQEWIAELQSQAAQGVPTLPIPSGDPSSEAGDGAQLAHLTARIAELETRLESLGAPVTPAGFDTTTINGTSRLIAYY